MSLKLTQFGNPILRSAARQLGQAEIASPYVRKLIDDMRHVLQSVKLGIGLAAPQVGQGIAVAVIVIQATKHRPDVEPFEMVLINPAITQTYGRKKQLWEGCISSGKGTTGLFAKVPRFHKIKVKFLDETGKTRHQIYEGLKAHVIQHETDHLQGVLFVDRVKDPKTYMTYGEYIKMTKQVKA